MVGAGIGDPDLITVKGMKALQNADAILYDALVNNALLDYAPEHCVKIYVGKRAHMHSHSQEDINQILIETAQKYKNVVRLKGGDPFVFGRGHEELEVAEAAGIKVEVIPGISSAIAAPEAAGIPVTRRGMSDSFWVMAGCNKDGTASEELKTAAKTDATVVLLMGVGKLKRIIDVYRTENKYDLPVAIIQDGSLMTQKTVIGTVDTIEDLAVEHNISTPSVIVIGKVASLGKTETFITNKSKDTIQDDLSQLSIKEDKNELFPVFLKLNELKLLIVGGGYVGLEKVTAVLDNSPQTHITLVAPEIREEIVALSQQYPNLTLQYKPYDSADLNNCELVIVATNDKTVNKQIKADCKQRRLLCNVADTPSECDFYLSSVIKKGSLKMAVSTNGKSPTIAKRIREVLDDTFPDELESVLTRLVNIRTQLKGDFTDKVLRLNDLTSVLMAEGTYPTCEQGCFIKAYRSKK